MPYEPDIIERFISKLHKSNNCWLWLASKNTDGYGQFKINNKKHLAHRVSYEIYSGDITCGLMVLHSCDNPSCVNPKHLRLGTSKENTKDMITRNRKGSNKKRINPNIACKIRKMYSSGNYSQRQLANIFNTSPTNVRNIIKFNTWKRV